MFQSLRRRKLNPSSSYPLFSLLPLRLSAMSGLVGLLVGLVLVGSVSSAKFDELFQPGWALDHFIYDGELLSLKLDNYSGK